MAGERKLTESAPHLPYWGGAKCAELLPLAQEPRLSPMTEPAAAATLVFLGKKRTTVPSACALCRLSHRCCAEARPCPRCVVRRLIQKQVQLTEPCSAWESIVYLATRRSLC